MRIGVLNNLRAGSRRANASRVHEVLRGHPDVYQVDTERSRDLAPALSELLRREIDVLVIHGGDGIARSAS